MAAECFNPALGVVAPMSFCEQTKFLHDVYKSRQDHNAITVGELRMISSRVGLPRAQILSWFDWFDDEKSRREDLLARKNISPHISNLQLPLSPNRTTNYGLNNTVSISMPYYPPLSPNTSAQIDDIFAIPTPSENLTVPLRAKRG